MTHFGFSDFIGDLVTSFVCSFILVCIWNYYYFPLMFTRFSTHSLCLLEHLSLPLSSSLPASLSDETVMTPDAENAVISPILPFLFLGNERDAQDLDLLLRLNIGYVVNVTTHLPLYHVKSGLRYKRLPATDNSKQNLRQYFEEVFEFIGESPTADMCLCAMLHRTFTPTSYCELCRDRKEAKFELLYVALFYLLCNYFCNLLRERPSAT